MSVIQNTAPLSPDSSIMSGTPEAIILGRFKLKVVGTGATRNTLVDSDSLSSYSWPEETSRQNSPRQKTG